MPFSPIVAAVAASLILIDCTAAASSFKPNCTLPTEGVNYVSGPNVRGTLTILWNCLSIVLLCTWNILHLNIPASRSHTQSLVKRALWAILDSRTKVKWMIFTVLAPEYLVGKALNDWLSARWEFEDFANIARVEGTEWETVHGYYANLGGFVLDFTELEVFNNVLLGSAEMVKITTREANGNPPISQPTREDPARFLRHLIDGMLLDESSPVTSVQRINLVRMRHSLWALNIGQLAVARHGGLIHTLPKVSANELKGLDRGDTLVKAIAVIQVLWLIVQLIVRNIANLYSSQLEVAALAFSASSVMTYVLYLGRPKGVTNVTRIKAAKLPTVLDIEILLRYSPSYLWTGKRGEGKSVGDLDLAPLPNDACNPPAHYMPDKLWEAVHGNTEILTLMSGAIIGGAVFGGVHCVAWNFQFPTTVERLLWRIASILTSVMPLISIPFNYYWIKINAPFCRSSDESQTSRFLVSTVLVAFAMIYLAARLFIMVEIFRSLFFLPPDAFIDTWSSSFPHLG
jgi:hypothetical protein